jgi:two-component system OmpR family sensor kinase/two-component system sensor histidine kinase BaeS
MLFLAVLLIASGAVVGFYLHSQGAPERPQKLIRFGFCFLPILLSFLAMGIGIRAFRQMGNPLVNVMAAADALAEGDLSVRIPERGPREFLHLTRSFNRMAEELERADHQRRSLTADVAHELRTPLHIIQGNLEGVLDGVYEPSDEHIGATLEETRLLARLVDDLQTLSLVEAGQLRLKSEPVNVSELLHDVSTSFSGQAEAAGVDLRVELQEDDHKLSLTGDGDRLDQVLSNLIANALRHTPWGGDIVLEAGTTPKGVRIAVQDSGEGISEEALPHIFDRFWKSNRARSRAGGAGSGLGLAIARQLVRAHGGEIKVESKLGQGTTFTIELPTQ